MTEMVWAYDENRRRAHSEKGTDDRYTKKKKQMTTKDAGKMPVKVNELRGSQRSRGDKPDGMEEDHQPYR